ncbi:Bug family tripartite tricarboxylate transporter substrate binding protein [Phreatobacter oligotrophus]|uniref:Bug family tripartite tricarboxylate transporter substrate binding protein n=1 Tax=Phreatobacter oligotrophus TaxID=1122261 RepID=UPI002354902E|nr:tripartite tricarboxylate transporter substrate-binding protein [Phreatobacter oligotrophus]MBX9992482.1 tripartite tricarboxylate transporter substrate binding protein [Phreatobacter oligotrophus]
MPTRRAAVAALLSTGLMPRMASAQAWPRRPVMLMHGFGAGGNADSISRVVANALSQDLGEQVVVEAKPGAGGNLASEQVARATPDGHTIILLTGGHAVSAALYKSLRFNPVDDFAFASLVATFPFVIAARADSPIQSIAQLVEAAKREPGKLTFSSVGFGSTQHLAGELFAETAGIKLTHVPYRGGMQPLSDLMSGRIDLMVDSITVTGAAIRAGTIRGLGVTSREPWPALPEVVPIATTLPGFEVRSWIGIAAPAATPAPVIARLEGAINKALLSAQVREQLGFLGVKPEGSTPEAMKAFVVGEIERWKRVVRASGIEQL